MKDSENQVGERLCKSPGPGGGKILKITRGKDGENLARQAGERFCKITELGLEILSLDARTLAPTEIADLECVVRNSGLKPVESFVAVWRVTRASQKVQLFNHVWDNSLARGMPKLLPGDSVTITSGKYTCPPTDPFRQVTAQIDYVRYADGTSAGPNEAKMALMLNDPRMTVRWLRQYLFGVYKERGLEALLDELRPGY